MERVLVPWCEILELNTDLVFNCLEGMSDADAARRVIPSTNSIAFLVAHLADARYFMARLLGRPAVNPLEKALGGVTSIEDAEELPTLTELRGIWSRASRHLIETVESVSKLALEAGAPQRFPVGSRSVFGGLTFLIQHESYHLGQLGLLRKGIGLGAMNYDRSRSTPT